MIYVLTRLETDDCQYWAESEPLATFSDEATADYVKDSLEILEPGITFHIWEMEVVDNQDTDFLDSLTQSLKQKELFND